MAESRLRCSIQRALSATAALLSKAASRAAWSSDAQRCLGSSGSEDSMSAPGDGGPVGGPPIRCHSGAHQPALLATTDADVTRLPRPRYTAPDTTIPNSQLRSAPASRPVDTGPCSAPTRPASTDHPAINPARNAMIPLQLMSP